MADFEFQGDPAGVMRGIGAYEVLRPQLTHPNQWPQARQTLIGYGLPQEWLPETFGSHDEFNQFLDHADRMNQRIRVKLTGGDYPMYPKSSLPAQPTGGALYDPQRDFETFIKDSYELGIAPPASASPEDIQAWKTKNSARLEQQRIGKHKPGMNGVTWGGTWGI